MIFCMNSNVGTPGVHLLGTPGVEIPAPEFRTHIKGTIAVRNISTVIMGPYGQCCASGSGSGRIRNYLQVRIRIRN